MFEAKLDCEYWFNRSVEEEAIGAERSAARIVVVMPTLNECRAVGRVVGGIKQVMAGYDCRVLVVDGHSADGTDVIARERGAMVIYQRGKGYGDALKTGFFYARKRMNAEVVVMMDADLTYAPEDLPRLVAPVLADDADLVVGNRFSGMKKGAMPMVNRFGNRGLSLVAKMALGLNVYDTQSGMRAFRSELLEKMTLVAVGMPLAMEILAEARSVNARIREVPISYSARVGETKLHPIKDGGRILGTTVRLMFDVRPLLFFGSIGTALGVLGLLLHYIMRPIEWVNVLFQLAFMVVGIVLFGIGCAIVIIKKLRTRKSG